MLNKVFDHIKVVADVLMLRQSWQSCRHRTLAASAPNWQKQLAAHRQLMRPSAPATKVGMHSLTLAHGTHSCVQTNPRCMLVAHVLHTSKYIQVTSPCSTASPEHVSSLQNCLQPTHQLPHIALLISCLVTGRQKHITTHPFRFTCHRHCLRVCMSMLYDYV